MSKHMTIINLACTITKLRKWGEAWKHSAESAQAATARMHQANKDLERAKFITEGLVDKLIADRDAAWTERDTQAADHSRQLTEHRAAFGARTEADAKIIAGLRSEIGAARMAVLERDSLISERAKLQAMVKEQSDSAKAAGELLGWTANESPIQAVERVVRERDGLLTQVQDLVAERDALRAEGAELKTQLERLTSWAAKNQAARETLQNEIEKLKSQTPKQHPVKVGEWARRTTPHIDGTPAGSVQQVRAILPAGTESSTVVYEMQSGSIWAVDYCEPCDPPSHDTEAGKAVAESAVSAEPVAEEIKVGDLGEVFQATTRTLNSDVGITGCVSSIHLDPCHGGFLVKFDPSTQSRRSAGMQAFGLCDVRKVTT